MSASGVGGDGGRSPVLAGARGSSNSSGSRGGQQTLRRPESASGRGEAVERAATADGGGGSGRASSQSGPTVSDGATKWGAQASGGSGDGGGVISASELNKTSGAGGRQQVNKQHHQHQQEQHSTTSSTQRLGSIEILNENKQRQLQLKQQESFKQHLEQRQRFIQQQQQEQYQQQQQYSLGAGDPASDFLYNSAYQVETSAPDYALMASSAGSNQAARVTTTANSSFERKSAAINPFDNVAAQAARRNNQPPPDVIGDADEGAAAALSGKSGFLAALMGPDECAATGAAAGDSQQQLVVDESGEELNSAAGVAGASVEAPPSRYSKLAQSTTQSYNYDGGPTDGRPFYQRDLASLLQECRGSRKLVILIVAIALLLDNMLLTSVVPIIPAYLYKLRRQREHRELLERNMSLVAGGVPARGQLSQLDLNGDGRVDLNELSASINQSLADVQDRFSGSFFHPRLRANTKRLRDDKDGGGDDDDNNDRSDDDDDDDVDDVGDARRSRQKNKDDDGDDDDDDDKDDGDGDRRQLADRRRNGFARRARDTEPARKRRPTGGKAVLNLADYDKPAGGNGDEEEDGDLNADNVEPGDEMRASSDRDDSEPGNADEQANNEQQQPQQQQQQASKWRNEEGNRSGKLDRKKEATREGATSRVKSPRRGSMGNTGSGASRPAPAVGAPTKDGSRDADLQDRAANLTAMSNRPSDNDDSGADDDDEDLAELISWRHVRLLVDRLHSVRENSEREQLGSRCLATILDGRGGPDGDNEKPAANEPAPTGKRFADQTTPDRNVGSGSGADNDDDDDDDDEIPAQIRALRRVRKTLLSLLRSNANYTRNELGDLCLNIVGGMSLARGRSVDMAPSRGPPAGSAMRDRGAKTSPTSESSGGQAQRAPKSSARASRQKVRPKVERLRPPPPPPTSPGATRGRRPKTAASTAQSTTTQRPTTTTDVSMIGDDEVIINHQDIVDESFEVGVMFASKPIMQAIANPFVGALTNRVGFTLPMFVGFTILFLSTLVFAFGSTYATLFMARAIQGVGSACTSVAGMSMIADRFPDDAERGNAMAVALGGLALGVVIGPPFGGFMYELFGKSSPFIVLAALALMDGLLQLLVLQPSVSKSQEEGASLMTLIKDPYILVAAGAITFANTGIGILEPALPLWMMDTMHARNWEQGVAFLPAALSYLFSTNLFGNLGLKIGRWRSAMLGLVIIGFSLLLIPFATRVDHLILPNGAIGFAIGMVDSTMMPMLGYLVDIRHTSVYGSVYAIGDVAFCASFVFGPALSGTLVELIGFEGLIITTALICFAFAPLLVMLRDPPASQLNGALMQEQTSLRYVNFATVGEAGDNNSGQASPPEDEDLDEDERARGTANRYQNLIMSSSFDRKGRS